ncbi:sensor histidine kinase [Deinococcus pimensis]|uniref:sensor histidine kinase n=1 Tax=Deinococcus pimensis TaxID=309888 RepID=UPI0006949F00|nr:ATP-binding protein [Deinococcus pimensis]
MPRPSSSDAPDLCVRASRFVTRASWFPYALAVVTSVVALLLRFALTPVMDDSAAYVFSLMAVTLTAFLGGFRAGLVATLLSVAGVNYLITEPVLAFNLHLSVQQFGGVAAFILTGLAVSWFGSNRQATLRRLAAARDTLEDREAQLRALTDNLPRAVTYQAERLPGGRTRFLYVSSNVERLLGVTPQEALADPARLYDLILPEYVPIVLEAEERAVRTRTPFEVEVPFRRLDGEVRWMFLASQRRELSGGRDVWNGVQLDVTERRTAQAELERLNATLEVRVRERTAQLERSNRELAEFAHVASHDLKAPIRTIVSFLQLLERRYADRLDDGGRRYITVTVQAAERMHRLVEELLAYSKVGRERSRERVDARRVLDEVLHDLDSTLRERGARVTAGPLPVVTVNETQLRQVLLNLIANAVKFQPIGQAPQVNVQAERKGDMVRFSVSDNGLGIPEAYRERVFGMFERLHARDEYEGTGLGLALVRRIVEEHGGRVWVDSTAQEGSTFHFTVPGEDATG